VGKSAKANLGHRRRLTHADKRKIAEHMASKGYERYPGVFEKLGWRIRKMSIMKRVVRQQTRAKYYARIRREDRERLKNA
jgi:hypothetical protein